MRRIEELLQVGVHVLGIKKGRRGRRILGVAGFDSSYATLHDLNLHLVGGRIPSAVARSGKRERETRGETGREREEISVWQWRN